MTMRGSARSNVMGTPTWQIEFANTLELRDYFAGQALAGILSQPHTNMADACCNPDKAAEWSYNFADAMLKARGSHVEVETK